MHSHARPRPINGWLFLTSGASIEVVDGATIDLGGKQWGVRMSEDGPIELSRATNSDDGRARVAQWMDCVAHEVG